MIGGRSCALLIPAKIEGSFGDWLELSEWKANVCYFILVESMKELPHLSVWLLGFCYLR